jgi:hypothetical protein
MIPVNSVRERIESKIFHANVVSTAIRKPFTSQTLDAYGDATKTFGANQNFELVPYVNRVEQINHQPFGNFQEGDVAAVIRYSQSMAKDDVVTFKGTEYCVEEIVDYNYGNLVVAKAIRLVRKV